jgi:hypothetical protein
MYYSNEYRVISRVSQVHVNHSILPVESEDPSYNRHPSSTSTPPPPLILSLCSHPHAPARSQPRPESRQAMMAELVSIQNSSIIRNKGLTLSKSSKHSLIIPIAFFKSSSSITRGGAKRILRNKRGNISECSTPPDREKSKTTNVHIDVCRLRQHTPTLQEQTELPSSPSLRALRLINDDSVQQPPTPHARHKRVLQFCDGRAEELSELERTLGEILFDENVESGHGNGTSQWVAVRRRTASEEENMI